MPLPGGELRDPALEEPLRLGPNPPRVVSGRVRLGRRGRRSLATTSLLVRDPLQISSREVRGAGKAEVLVLPRTEPILRPGEVGEGGEGGAGPARASASARARTATAASGCARPVRSPPSSTGCARTRTAFPPRRSTGARSPAPASCSIAASFPARSPPTRSCSTPASARTPRRSTRPCGRPPRCACTWPPRAGAPCTCRAASRPLAVDPRLGAGPPPTPPWRWWRPATARRPASGEPTAGSRSGSAPLTEAPGARELARLAAGLIAPGGAGGAALALARLHGGGLQRVRAGGDGARALAARRAEAA